MSNQIQKFIDTYGEAGTDEILSRPTLTDDVDLVSAQIETLAGAERTKVEHVLQHVLKAIDQELKTLTAEQAGKYEALKKSQDSAEACIAYSSAARRETKNNDEY